jgi:hypothetical protein
VDLNRTPARIADAAAEEIRALNHRTINEDAFDEPAHVYSAIVNLDGLLQGLPQALEQIQHALNGMEKRGEVRMDNGSDPAVSVTEACQALGRVRSHIAAAESVMQQAVNMTARMGGHFTDGEDDDVQV